MQDANRTDGGVGWTSHNARDGYITLRRRDGVVTRVKVFCSSGAYDDWSFAQDVAQTIFCLPRLLDACDRARRRLSDEDSRETEIDWAFDSSMNWYGTSDGACGVEE